MPEFLRIDPADLVEDPVIEEYSSSPTNSVCGYLMYLGWLAIIFLFSALEFLLEPQQAKDTRFFDEGPHTLSLLAAAVAFLAIAPMLFWFWRYYVRRHKFGSWINIEESMIYWWDSEVDADIHKIDINDLEEAFVNWGDEETSGEICLFTTASQKIVMPLHVVKNPQDWVRTLTSRFPHIRALELRDVETK